MFEDLITDKQKKVGQKATKDSVIKAMTDNIRDKDEFILELLDELNNKSIEIDDLTKELDYLKQL